MNGQLTPNQVVSNLAQLARDLDTTVRQLESAEIDAVTKRSAADLAYGQAFLDAVGAVEQRKQIAVVDTHEVTKAADLADAVVRNLRRRVDAIKVRIDVGRSYGAAVRAEISLAGHGGTP